MDNFKVIYKILKLLEVAMDCDEFDRNQLTAEYLGISKNRLDAILTMLQEEGYVHGDVCRGTSWSEIRSKLWDYVKGSGVFRRKFNNEESGCFNKGD